MFEIDAIVREQPCKIKFFMSDLLSLMKIVEHSHSFAAYTFGNHGEVEKLEVVLYLQVLFLLFFKNHSVPSLEVRALGQPISVCPSSFW